LHAIADAKMEKGQGEWRIMMQIGCRCPLDKQDAFLELVREFEGRRCQPTGASSSASRARFAARRALRLCDPGCGSDGGFGNARGDWLDFGWAVGTSAMV
jgi:hypothetical protein